MRCRRVFDLDEQARRQRTPLTAARDALRRPDPRTPLRHFTERLELVRDSAGHDHWRGTAHTTDLDVEAERSSSYRGSCAADPTCVREDHR